MNYQYSVRDPLGNVLNGRLDAASEEDAAQQLCRDGFQVLDLDEADGAGLFGSHVSRSDIIYTTAQLAIMVDTGITLSAALAGIVEQEQNPGLRRVLNDLKDAVQSGDDFSSALARFPKLFDKTYVSLVRASEATGSLGPMLERISCYLRKEAESRGKVRAAMAYPMVMMVLATGVTIFLLTYILPKFTPLFKAKGKLLPGPTRLMMGLSDAILGYWPFWIAGIARGWSWACSTPGGPRPGGSSSTGLKIRLPILGPMFRKIAISRSIRTLGTMLASGVSILESLKLCGEVAGNYHYERLWDMVREQVTAGKRVCEVLRGHPLSPAFWCR